MAGASQPPASEPPGNRHFEQMILPGFDFSFPRSLVSYLRKLFRR